MPIVRKAMLAVLIAACAACSSPSSSDPEAEDMSPRPEPRERHVTVDGFQLFTREIGQGAPIIVLHGGPDFDHSYLLPDLDRLADSYRLIYYDQRGRGRSAAGVQPEDVTLASEMTDLDAVRQEFQLERAALLGHSWGALLAVEYAVRHPERVSHLILLNPAPVSAADFARFRKAYAEKLGSDLERLTTQRGTSGYKEGDPDAVTAYYRIHFRPALTQPAHVEAITDRLRASFTKDGILKARAIEDRLVQETWLRAGYDVLPKLSSLRIPSLVIYSEHDFIPPDVAVHIAQAIPDARLIGLRPCGHFSYFDCPEAVRTQLDDFFGR